MSETLNLAHKRLVGNFVNEVFVKKNLSELDRFMREDYIQHNPLAKKGMSGFKAYIAKWFDAVPNWTYTLRKIIAEDDHVWIYGTYAGTLKKEWLGIEPRGQKYTYDAVDIFRIEDRRIAEHWDVMDVYQLYRQLGVVAPPPRKAASGRKATPIRKPAAIRKAA